MNNHRVVWLTPDDPANSFPPVENALREPNGLLAAGGDLGSDRLLAAYRNGIFPWYDAGQPVLWWSPDPRCVFQKGDFRLSRRLQRDLRNSAIEIRFNTAFSDVIRECAKPRIHQNGTWITPEMIRAYELLHQDGWAHSIEVWQEEELVGGLYGPVIGKALFGESMFSSRPNASKVALLTLNCMIEDGILGIIDCQVQSNHLSSLGASVIPRSRFIELLDHLCTPPERFDDWPSAPVAASDLLRK